MVIRVSAQFVLALAIVLTIGCDRVTKHVATAALAGTGGHSFLADTVRLQYAENTGGFLGVGGDLHPGIRTSVFTVATGAMLLGMVAAAIRWRVRGVALLGLALFFGDGMLTPAISVLSAVEGLSVENASFQPLVIPLTLIILVGLFAIQSSGTAKIGSGIRG